MPSNTPPPRPYLTDLSLARRLEYAEARANVAFVEARAADSPGSGATWCEVAGTYAMFDGVESPCTQTFGFGLFTGFVLIPQFAEAPTSTGYGFGASVTAGSILLVPLTVAMLIVSMLVGRALPRIGPSGWPRVE